MSTIKPIIKKELRSYFNSPIAYLAITFFLVFTAVWNFYLQNFLVRNMATLREYFGIMPTVFIILIPALTMRSWAEEKKLGTEEILLTLPFREIHLVIGKFLATFILFGIMILLTIPVPLTLSALGNFEMGEIIGEYVGIILLGAASIAIGQFISSITNNQITAFIVSVIVLMFITLISRVNFLIPTPNWLSSVINYISLTYHFESFRKGLLDSRDLLYFVILCGMFLYFNTKTLIFRKWK